ncbi:MAG: dihydrofolate reductase [Rhodocyclaceae bacterium]|jgi:dihydrofolate reductase|nr:dihydrofolate reductase [Rhodocyclaceae bacterium]
MTINSRLILIAAVARNGVIGRENALPWRLKADMRHFRNSTMGHPILMGRKTWESLGRALPGRRNLVLSRRPDYVADGGEVFTSLEDALASTTGADKVFVIGGAELYAQTLARADALMLTEVWTDAEGDARFPEIDWTRFEEVSRQSAQADADNEHDYDFVEYRRR